MFVRSIWRRFVTQIHDAGTIGFCLVLVLNLLLDEGVGKNALAAPDTVIRQEEINWTARNWPFALPTGSYNSLVKMDVEGSIREIDLPIHAHLSDALGNEYVLIMAGPNEVGILGRPYHILDSAAEGTTYLIGFERRKGAREEAARHFSLLLNDGRQVIVRDQPGARERLAEMGFDIKVLPAIPMVVEPPIPPDTRMIYDPRLAGLSVIYDPVVAELMDQITQDGLNQDVGNLSGEIPIDISGSLYTIITRYTGSAALEKATQYLHEQMAALDLAVSYHNWYTSWGSGRNVIGSLPGKVKPDEIVLVTAHLDDLPGSTQMAPGADDNASSAAALLNIARVVSQKSFDRTLRFVFFTGEEQGLLGSMAYAASVTSAGDNIVAVYNMDMIGWDSVNGPILRLHTRLPSNPGYGADKAIADLFSEVVSTYGLSSVLTPVIDADGEWASDHSSFWDKGFAGILAIEDDKNDFNPYYHTTNDKRQYLNMAYLTNFARASAATVAHLGVPHQSPDFVVTGTVLTPASPSANGTFTALVTVKNQGTVAGVPGMLQVWANQANAQACGATGNRSTTLTTSLAAGASTTVTVSGLPAGAAGAKTLRAFVDSQCQIAEVSDTNNQTTQVYTVMARPDFVVTGVVLRPSGPSANRTFSVVVTVKNQGTAAGVPGKLQVWANQTKAYGCGAVGNTSATLTTSLAAGSSTTVKVGGLPAGAVGAKMLRVFVDSHCQTVEADDTNNQTTKTYTVFARPIADLQARGSWSGDGRVSAVSGLAGNLLQQENRVTTAQ